MIHHWVGAMFVPNTTLDQVMSVLENNGRYSEIYKPLLRDSSVLERMDGDIRLNVVAVQKAFSVTAAVATDDHVHIARLDPKRLYITCNALHVQEIADYWRPASTHFPRIVGRVRRAGGPLPTSGRARRGVYVELATVVLSRGIPVEFRWLIKPLIEEISRKMMIDSLNDTRTGCWK